jgi:hypothetical protein
MEPYGSDETRSPDHGRHVMFAQPWRAWRTKADGEMAIAGGRLGENKFAWIL